MSIASLRPLEVHPSLLKALQVRRKRSKKEGEKQKNGEEVGLVFEAVVSPFFSTRPFLLFPLLFLLLPPLPSSLFYHDFFFNF